MRDIQNIRERHQALLKEESDNQGMFAVPVAAILVSAAFGSVLSFFTPLTPIFAALIIASSCVLLMFSFEATVTSFAIIYIEVSHPEVFKPDEKSGYKGN